MLRKEAEQLKQQGNFQDALIRWEQLIENPSVTGAQAASDLQAAIECSNQLGLAGRLDQLLDRSLRAHPNDWHVSSAAASALVYSTSHNGMIFNQKFEREPRDRNNGRWINVTSQDERRGLALMVEALRQATGESLEPTFENAPPAKEAAPKATPQELASLWASLAGMLMHQGTRNPFELQWKTPLDMAPDYLDVDASNVPYQRYAPVDEQGNPIFWKLPANWSDASSNAERLRYALKKLEALDHSSYRSAIDQFVRLLDSLYSVQTLQESMSVFRQSESSEDVTKSQSSILALHTLAENETIAKLASGIKRFELPDDLNPFRIRRELARGNDSIAILALESLANAFQDRRQYTRAAEVLEETMRRFPQNAERDIRAQYESIVKPRGTFEPTESQPAGQGAKVSFVFRNAKQVRMVARPVDLEKLLADIKETYRGLERGKQPAFGGIEGNFPPPIEMPSELFSGETLDRYVGEEVANWSLKLEPRENHWDRRMEIATPLQKAGLYVVVAHLDESHEFRTLLWIHDLALVRKPIDGGQLLLVADAVSGAPIASANVEHFGVIQQYRNQRQIVQTRTFAKKSDAQGQVILKAVDLTPNAQWMTIVRTGNGKLAVLGLQGMFAERRQPEPRMGAKAYGVCDQPVHRPGDKIKAKFWIASPSYDRTTDARPVAGRTHSVQLVDPQGKVFWQGNRTTDSFGGIDVEVDLPKNASLGTYQFQIGQGRSFIATSLRVRVEEFRKPEFEVKISAPDKPVKLGDKIEVKVNAKYYFGSPVTDASAHVTVTRSSFQDSWFPVRPFDWCYGPGYWWRAYEYDWYPGWSNWRGCVPPHPWWIPRWGFEPPESILDQELQLNSQGEATFVIDSSIAAELFGKTDHKYNITVEVRDASRRTITASSSVTASRAAFRIYSWLNRGYYQVNDTAEVHFAARTPDGKGIAGAGTIQLLHITYDKDRKPEETVVDTWNVKTDDDGSVIQRFVTARTGQYRIRLVMKDSDGRDIEGGYVFTVRGANDSGADFRFSQLELIPDKEHYAVGDKVKLQINADRNDARVLLFVRPTAGINPLPQLVQLTQKTHVVELDVVSSDQPNFFVEAVSVYDGGCYSTVREILVPPQKRVLDVQLLPNKSAYLPGEDAELSIQVRDLEGKPVSGSLVVAVYDRALEQIAPDTLPGDIREFFWKWRRSHHVQLVNNLDSIIQPVLIPTKPAWQPLGIFGYSLADEEAILRPAARITRGIARGGRMAGGADFAGGFGGGVAEAMSDGMPMMKSMDILAMGAPPVSTASAGGGEAVAAPAKLRTQFADSALWLVNVSSDSSGQAKARFKMPENLTDWQMKAWAMGSDIRVGSTEVQSVTRKNLMVRIASPRFLVERDEVVLSAIVHNDLRDAQPVQIRLEIDGETQLVRLDSTPASQTVSIDSHAQARVDWRCKAIAEGNVKIRVVAETPVESDAMQMELPIRVYGSFKTDSWAGSIRPGEEQSLVKVMIPSDRRIDQSKLTVRMSPSLALAMIDALPYLAAYPYGCTEQTLNRFLPTVITQKTLQSMQVDLAKVKERRVNLNAQELGNAAERRERWKRFEHNAVFDLQEVNDMVDSGVQKLTEMQNQDGGWGWFSGFRESSWPHTTATVVRGLLIARENDVAIVPDVIDRGLQWLEAHQHGEVEKLKNFPSKKVPYKEAPDNTDALVFHILVKAKHQLGSSDMVTMQSELYEKRLNLSTYGKSLLALAAHWLGNPEQRDMLRQNIEQFLVHDASNDTAYLRDKSDWWFWYGSEIEANACYLQLLALTDAKNRTASGLVKYLLNNRKHGTYWNNTRDTALVVEAFGAYLKSTGEASFSSDVEVWLDGKRLGTVSFKPETMLSTDGTIEIQGNAVPTGQHELVIRRKGAGPLYWNVYATNFSQEETIPAAGLEVKVQRKFYQLTPVKKDKAFVGGRGQIVESQTNSFDRTPIEDLKTLPSGTLVEVELLVESKNDYEYLIIEDLKAAGLEPVDIRSGYEYADGLMVYREFREQHVAFFAREVRRGKHSLRYQVRAEAPGQFTALPAVIQGMYAPELVGNSTDFDFRISD